VEKERESGRSGWEGLRAGNGMEGQWGGRGDIKSRRADRGGRWKWQGWEGEREEDEMRASSLFETNSRY
jgi:hypothetical protein